MHPEKEQHAEVLETAGWQDLLIQYSARFLLPHPQPPLARLTLDTISGTVANNWQDSCRAATGSMVYSEKCSEQLK
eukprot:6200186-Pleurochrysis_carterae.AAC.1